MTHKSYSSGFGSVPNSTPNEIENKTIQVIVQGGVVVDVKNLPDGYVVQIVDKDENK